METSAAYRAACDSIIDERSLLELLEHDDEEIGKDNAPAPSIAGIQLTPEKVADAVNRYFAESEPGHRANISTLGHMLAKEFPGIPEGWAGQRSLSQLLKKVCKLKVEKVENKTVAWQE